MPKANIHFFNFFSLQSAPQRVEIVRHTVDNVQWIGRKLLLRFQAGQQLLIQQLLQLCHRRQEARGGVLLRLHLQVQPDRALRSAPLLLRPLVSKLLKRKPVQEQVIQLLVQHLK